MRNDHGPHLLVRGVNTLVPHTFSYSLRGERSQERPPDLGMNSLFWPWYGKYAAYAARLSALNGEGLRLADTAVVCAGDDMPAAECAPLYRAQVPFRYLDQALLCDSIIEGGRLRVVRRAGERFSVRIFMRKERSGASGEQEQQ